MRTKGTSLGVGAASQLGSNLQNKIFNLMKLRSYLQSAIARSNAIVGRPEALLVLARYSEFTLLLMAESDR
jgi:hypothetical protein